LDVILQTPHTAKAPADQLSMQQQSEGTTDGGCQHLPKSITR